MVMVNKVLMAGNVTADPDLRFLGNGSAVCEFTIALNRSYTKRQTQERVEETSFIDVVAWGRTAEVCGEYLKKGRPALVEGRLTQSRWEGADGRKMSRLRVTAESVQFLGGRGPEGGAGREPTAPADHAGPEEVPPDPEVQSLFH